MLSGLLIRGGPDALLFVGGPVKEIIGKTLREVAEERGIDVIETAKSVVIETHAQAQVASFNMSEDDIRAFMKQPWVMTSSDGTNGHPRKYASFPRKFDKYVKNNEEQPSVIKISDFIYQSSGLTADTFGLCGRGYIKEGYIADLVILDPTIYKDAAGFFNPRELTSGVQYLIVNGVLAINEGALTGNRNGQILKRSVCAD